jgi:putative membrane protein
MDTSQFIRALVYSVTFGIVGLLLIILGFKLFDWATPKIDVEKELAERNNLAVAVVCAALVLGVSYVVAHAIA